MISREEFTELVDAIQHSNDELIKIENFIEAYTDSYVIIKHELRDRLVKFLDNHFGGDAWVSWWLYEDVDKIIGLEDGTEIDVNDVNKFYDFLVSLGETKQWQ